MKWLREGVRRGEVHGGTMREGRSRRYEIVSQQRRGRLCGALVSRVGQVPCGNGMHSERCLPADELQALLVGLK